MDARQRQIATSYNTAIGYHALALFAAFGIFAAGVTTATTAVAILGASMVLGVVISGLARTARYRAERDAVVVRTGERGNR